MLSLGVVGNTRAMELNNTDATEIYYPPAADNFPEMSVLVRAAGDPRTLTPALKAIADSIDSGLHPTITPLTAGFRKNVAQAEQIRDDRQLAWRHCHLPRSRGPSWSCQLRRVATDQRNRRSGSRSEPIAWRYSPPCCANLPGLSCSDWLPVWPLPRPVADFASRALRHQRTGSDQLRGRYRHSGRHPGCGCIAANPPRLSA